MSDEQSKEILLSLKGLHQWQTDHEIADAERNASLATPDFIIGAVKSAVEIQINGNLRDIKEHLTRQDVVSTEIKTEIVEVKEEQKRVQVELLKLQRDTKPAVEGLNILAGIRKFLLWVAAPFAILWAAIQYLINK